MVFEEPRIRFTSGRQLRPNPWGLYDMHGNVWEWCQERWLDASTLSSPINGYTEAERQALRVTRGGCWEDDAACCRVSFRSCSRPSDRFAGHGFRVVRTLRVAGSSNGKKSRSPADPAIGNTAGNLKLGPPVKVKPVSVEIKPEPIAIQPGQPMSKVAWVKQPAPIPGLRSWTIETRGNRQHTISVAFSPDGQILASGDGANAIRLWDAATGHLDRILLAHDDTKFGGVLVAWSPDGRFLASVGTDHTLRLWDPASGKLLRTLVQGDILSAVDWSPDGRLLATAGHDRIISVWQVSTGSLTAALAGHTEFVWNVVWSPDGKRLASCSSDHTIRIWDLRSASCLATLSGVDRVASVHWSPDGQLVAAACKPGCVGIWDAGSGRLLRVFDEECKEDFAECCGGLVAWSPDGRILVGSGRKSKPEPGEVNQRFWNAETGALIGERASGEPRNPLYDMAFSPDGKQLAVGYQGEPGRIEVLNVETRECRWTMSGSDDPVKKGLCISPEGHYRGSPEVEKELVYVALTDAGEQITYTPEEFSKKYGWKNDPSQIRLVKGKPVAPPQAAAIEIKPEPIAVKPGEPLSTMALVQRPAALPGVRSWSLETIGQRGGIHQLVFSPDSRQVLTVGDDGTIRIWDAPDGRLRKALVGHRGTVIWAVWSPDGRYIASGGADKSIRYWEADSGRLLLTVPCESEVWCLAWSADGRRLASGLLDNRILLWDAGSATDPLTLKGHTGFPRELAWSPDGKILASGAGDATLRLWDPRTGECKRTFSHGVIVTRIAWSPDGSRIAGIDYPDKVRIWNVESGQCDFQLTPGEYSELHGLTWDAAQGMRACCWNRSTNLWHWDAHGALDTKATLVPKEANRCVALAGSPGGRFLAAGGLGGAVQVYDGNSDQPLHALPHVASRVINAVVSPDGKSLACAHFDGSTRLWDTKTLSLQATVPGAGEPYCSCAYARWSPDGKRLAVSRTAANDEISIRVFDSSALGAASPPNLMEIAGIGSGCGRGLTDWSPDGKRLATGTFQPQVWDAATGQRVFAFGGTSQAVAWSPDGSLLAVGRDGELQVIDANTGQATKILRGAQNAITASAWTNDGKHLAAGNDKGKLWVWSLDTPDTPTALPEDHTGGVNLLRWLDEDKTLASSGPETCVREMPSGKPLRAISDGGSDVWPERRVLFSPGSSCVRLWNLDEGNLICTLLALRDGQHAVISPEGHVRGSPGAGKEFVYVALTDAGEQVTMTPEEFAKKYGWKNDPAKAFVDTPKGANP